MTTKWHKVLAAYLVDDITLMSIAFAPEIFESKMTWQLSIENRGGSGAFEKGKGQGKVQDPGNHQPSKSKWQKKQTKVYLEYLCSYTKTRMIAL